MKKVFIVLVTVLILASCWKEYNQNFNWEKNNPQVSNDILINDMWDNILSEVINWLSLSENEINWLIQMREEEKLARDVYAYFYSMYGQKIFWKIDDSEEKHKSAILPLLIKYSIDDPIVDDSYWVFKSEKISNLYNDLINTWSKSLIDALRVWMTIEDLDIKDLNELLTMSTDEDIIKVYNNLLKWSYNHIRAFNKNLEKNWETYIPQFLTLEEYNKIIRK